MILCELMERGLKPIKNHFDDGGFDLLFPEDFHMDSHQREAKLKIKILLPLGWTGLIRPRSSAYSDGAEVNGTIDRYTGEIFLTIKNTSQGPLKYKRSQSCAQLIPVFTGAGLTRSMFFVGETWIPKPTAIFLTYKLLTACNQLQLVNKLPETKRGDHGHGSTGRKQDS